MWTVFLRTILLYIVIITAMRLMGKRQVGQHEPNELVVMIMISELAAIPIQETEISLMQGLLPIITLVVFEVLLSLLLLKSIRIRRLVAGAPVVIIHNGILQRKQIARNRVTIDEIIEELRIKGITDLSTVQYAILETNGQLSALLFPEHQPVEAGQMQVQPEIKGMPVIVLNDGRWLDSNLRACGVNREFVLKELKSRGFSNVEQVYVAMIDELRHIYVSGRGE